MAGEKNWSFEIGSFMVLLGDQQETEYRMMQRTVIECLAAAPVAGLQSYLRPFTQLTDARGPEIISPRGCVRHPLLNMRLSHAISAKHLLRDGCCTVLEIPPESEGSHRRRFFKSPINVTLWVIFTWLLYGCIVYSVLISKSTSWIGISSCVVWPAASIVMRLLEKYILEVKYTRISNPDASSAEILSGRKNSCLVIEGSRRDVSQMTEFGLQTKPGWLSESLEILIRICALLLLLFVFVTTLNGSTWDQVGFVCVNLLGQLNNVVGRYLNSHRCIAKFQQTKELSPITRTHMYEFLLRRYGSGEWVDKVGLLPGTEIWKRWQQKIALDKKIDAKDLYEACHDEVARETPASARPTSPNEEGTA